MRSDEERVRHGLDVGVGVGVYVLLEVHKVIGER